MRSKPSKQAANVLLARAKPAAAVSMQTQFELAVSFHSQGRWQDAAVLYDSIIAAQPAHADASHMRGLLDAQLGDQAQAVMRISQAIALNATKSEYFNNRGLAFLAQQNYAEALGDFQQAIFLEPGLAQAHCNLGNVWQELHRNEEALICFDRAIELKPDYADAYFNRGNLWGMLKRPEKAIEDFDHALGFSPNDADYKYNKATALLLNGMYEQAWNLHESRWRRISTKHKHRQFDLPQWFGNESIHGKTILIHAEQGLGDTLQFIRYVPMVAALGATVILEVQAPLLSLFEKMQGISVLLKKGAPLPPFDMHCPMMSLPLAFKTTLDTVPACPHFVIPETKTQFWADKLGLKTKPRVGLVWNGGFRPDQPEIWDVNERRNLPLLQLKSLVGIDVEFISLQKGEPAESEFRQAVAAGWDGPLIHDHVHELKDFSHTAALVMNLDLVIAVDTSTAHLAASLSKPVWLLNRYDTCWRWLLERDDSPWYPSIKIYRQASWGDWDGVMQRVRWDLLELASRNAKK